MISHLIFDLTISQEQLKVAPGSLGKLGYHWVHLTRSNQKWQPQMLVTYPGEYLHAIWLDLRILPITCEPQFSWIWSFRKKLQYHFHFIPISTKYNATLKPYFEVIFTIFGDFCMGLPVFRNQRGRVRLAV